MVCEKLGLEPVRPGKKHYGQRVGGHNLRGGNGWYGGGTRWPWKSYAGGGKVEEIGGVEKVVGKVAIVVV